ncbi:EAL domain-containing protein [Paraburkholderia strydomiana]|uniref:EAL domain-containing protein n=1 Tax=Paraburkholderia strydomiana TaxID=1245417 RepID=UPI0038BC9C90
MSRHLPVSPFHLAVNVAPRDLRRKGFVTAVLAAARRLPSGFMLVLELTERFALDDNPKTSMVFQTLRAHGIRFAIDDFGTQHSNLDLLGRFPFDFVKIDRQFVDQVDKGGVELIRGIALVAKHFGAKVVAEGVETEAQHQALRRIDVQYAQGYLYHRPVRVEQLAQHYSQSAVP